MSAEIEFAELLEKIELDHDNVGKIIHAIIDAAYECDASYADIIQACQSVSASTVAFGQARMESLMDEIGKAMGAQSEEEPPTEQRD